jgi:hypothetical protein
MLKQALITSALLLGSTSQLSASLCTSYGTFGLATRDFFFVI